MNYYVYILKSNKDSKLYIGQTNNLTNRLERHNTGQVRATRSRRPLTLIYSEGYATRSEAIIREKYLKSLKGALGRKLQNESLEVIKN